MASSSEALFELLNSIGASTACPDCGRGRHKSYLFCIGCGFDYKGGDAAGRMQAKASRWYALIRIPAEALSPEEKRSLEQLTSELEDRLTKDAPWFMWLLEQPAMSVDRLIKVA